MEKITIDLPEDLQFMRKMPSIEWSFIATKILQSKLEEVSNFKRIISKSKATEKDVTELTEKINESLSKRH